MQTTLMALCLWLRMPHAAALRLGSAPLSRALCWGGGGAGGIHRLCSFVGKLAYLDSLGDVYS